MIYITGDTHGEQSRFIYCQDEKGWGADDTIIVCGDFGYIFEDNYSENRFLDDLEFRPYTICFVDGNHENFNALYKYPEEFWNGGRIHRIRKNIIHLMRGQIFTIEGKKFFAMGGAYSIDRYMRTENISWWEQELPNNDEYNEAIENLEKNNMIVDYVITHTAPKEIIYLMKKYPDSHELGLNSFLNYIYFDVEFKHWYCGHWHIDKEITDKFRTLWFDINTLE